MGTGCTLYILVLLNGGLSDVLVRSVSFCLYAVYSAVIGHGGYQVSILSAWLAVLCRSSKSFLFLYLLDGNSCAVI